MADADVSKTCVAAAARRTVHVRRAPPASSFPENNSARRPHAACCRDERRGEERTRRDGDAKLSGNGSRPESRTAPGRSSTWTHAPRRAGQKLSKSNASSFASRWRSTTNVCVGRGGDDDLKATVSARVHGLGRPVRASCIAQCNAMQCVCCANCDASFWLGIPDTSKKTEVTDHEMGYG
jgi:hypothetical protein